MKLLITTQRYLLFGLILLLGMIAIDAPIWITLFSSLLISYKILIEKRSLPPISRRLTTVLSIILLLLIYVQFRTFLGQEASTTLLVGLTALKILEYENSRDHKYLIVLGFMLLAMKPLFSLDLYWIPFLLIAFILLWLSMLSPNQRQPYQFIARVFVLSIPLAITLFFLFPRVILPWAKKTQEVKSRTGFSEELSPGSTSELVQTNILVFRAKFNNFNARSHQLYWRGAVLDHSNGLSWKVSGNRVPSQNDTIKESSNAHRIRYDVYLEPGNQNYIFALETPHSVFGTSYFVRGFENSVYRSNLQLEKTLLYRGVSSLQSYDTKPPREEHLQHPELSAEVVDFISSVKDKSEDEKVLFLNEFFKNSDFRYTLTPGVYGDNELEEFLFVRKEGFCEHFAGGYATLARALGLPARVIVGFQGGTWNSFGDFWSVSTKDAHAWVEIYARNRWIRVDPTALAMPLRIELGAQGFENAVATTRSTTEQNFRAAYDRVLAWIENINYTWVAFLIEFDRQYQRQLFQTIRQNLGWIMFGFMALLILVKLVSQWLLNKSNPSNEYQKILNKLFALGKKNGIPREPAESPEKYLARLSDQFPKAKIYLDEFYLSYEQSFYQNQSVELNRHIKKKILRPKNFSLK